MQTLQSAAAQTYSNLEILIVDDGSTDATARIAEQFCLLDNRARLIRKENGGQSSARNRGIDEAAGAWIAPLDADDLWHPEKIERQLQSFANAGPRVALTYCWYRMIDEQGRVCEPPWAPVMEGQVFRQHLALNFGTGSSPLIKRELLGDLRYSEEFTAHVDAGCEDWLLQLQLAIKYDIACTRAFLLGYRQRPGSTSSDQSRMIRSHVLMYEILLRNLSGEDRRVAERELSRWQTLQALETPEKATSLRKIISAARVASAKIAEQLRTSLKHRGRDFSDLSPDDLVGA